MRPFPERGDLWLLLAAVVCGAFFLASLGHVWPLVDTKIVVDRAALETAARGFLEDRGFDLEGYEASERMWVNEPALDYIERTFGRERAQAWIRGGAPLARHFVTFKRRGEVTWYVVDVHAEAGIQGFLRSMEEDEQGARIEQEQARGLARDVLAEELGVDVERWTEKSAATAVLIARTDHVFTWERDLSAEPELRERLVVVVAGDRVTSARRSVPVPPAARRDARAAEAPGRALEAVGFSVLGLALVGALFVFLTGLRDGSVRLGRAVLWPAVIFVCLSGTHLLRTSWLFVQWEPLWPRWLSAFQTMMERAVVEQWILLALLAVVAAGDALDRREGWDRGRSLWALTRGRFADPAVGAASLRGFLIGMICGAVLAGSVMLMEALAGARVPLQPRHFFFYAINSTSPSAITLLFFLGVALVEELGYRFFGGTALLRLTHRRWLAVVVPAVIYGLTHTRLGFLPPAEPFWGRPLAMALVGVCWGWAFLRYDALTVVLSHYAADLFIFNWPRLASGQTEPTVSAALTMLVPLVPGLLWLLRGTSSRPRGHLRR